MTATTSAPGRTEPIDLVYVAGTERAGSTLLELLLNAHSSIASCGELQVWPREITAGRGNRCGCGLPVVECPFWAELLARVDPLSQPEPAIHHFRRGWRGGPEYRARLAAQLRAASPEPPSSAERIYAENNHRVMRSVADLWEERSGTQPRWLLDASKDPYRLWWLLRSDRFRIKTVHLVRDPRGYIRSAAGVGSRVLSRAARLRKVAVQAAVWNLRNHLVREVLAHHSSPADHCTVAYESLARDPQGTLRRVCATIGCEFEPDMITRFRDVPIHAISGNAMRFEQRGIELDESWRQVLSRSEQALALGVSRLPPRLLLAALEARERMGGRRESERRSRL
jgi:hypothetical protein